MILVLGLKMSNKYSLEEDLTAEEAVQLLFKMFEVDNINDLLEEIQDLRFMASA